MSRPVPVAQLNKYVKALLDRDEHLSSIWVTGELSNFKAHVSGHFYFVLKDEKAQVSCVMFKGQNASIRFRPENGMKVVLRARASLFERAGSFQLYVSEMEPVGMGDLHLAFEQLKEKLQKEGLFDPEHKRALPVLPGRIGVVTSGSGAVIRDILNVLTRRFPEFNLILFPAPVQGPEAAPAIAAAIRYLNRHRMADVLIVGRGGGSMEDLWAFNEEVVARAIYESDIPVVSAVGHETDFTIADFVADVRAPTPSAAAEIVLPPRVELDGRLAEIRQRMHRNLNQRLQSAQDRLARLRSARMLTDPREILNRRQMAVDLLIQRLEAVQRNRLSKTERTLSLLTGKLDALSPLKVLARGYGMVSESGTGQVIRSVRTVRPGDRMDVRLSDGSIRSVVEQVTPTSQRSNEHE